MNNLNGETEGTDGHDEKNSSWVPFTADNFYICVMSVILMSCVTTFLIARIFMGFESVGHWIYYFVSTVLLSTAVSVLLFLHMFKRYMMKFHPNELYKEVKPK